MNIIIIGAGPCGLGAAWRLNELGHKDWVLYEKNSNLGGLSASFKDNEGFWWDIGGHVLFSHYPYFDRVMDTVFDKESEWLFHDRSAWVWMENRFIPYPIQNNIHRLPKEVFSECLHGLLDIQSSPVLNQNGQIGSILNQTSQLQLRHFGDWIDAGFGKGVAKHFLRPYNYKVWAYPVEELSHNWVGERVAKVDVKRIIDNYIFDRDDIGWGPNSRFRFPKYGGTGAIWEKVTAHLPNDKICLNKELVAVNIKDKTVEFKDGTIQAYDLLITTIPITEIASLAKLGLRSQSDNRYELLSDSAIRVSLDLKYSSTHVAGIGLKGNPPEYLHDKCWIYFPENNNPFYRVTVFSNYSPNNVPDIKTSWSLMCEVSESPMKPVNLDSVIEDIIDGAINTNLIKDKNQINHTWYKRVEKGYPTPSRDRNKSLFLMVKILEDHGILSRGRFGAWRYEVGNMDHSFMQGVEAANRALFQTEELTLWYPDIVNSPHPAK